MSLQLIFSFDSEDYITPQAAEAERWWAEAMYRHGIPASICVVGALARALRDRGERETVAAMSRHEISYHSDTHSAHPTHAELLEGLAWDEGVTAVTRREARGIQDVADLFGQWPVSFCKAGYSWGPQVPAAMRQMGIPVSSDSPFEWAPGEPLWFENMLGLGYHCSFDEYFDLPEGERLPRMQADFERRCSEFDGRTLVMYTHPCRLLTTEFWDTVNFRAGMNTPADRWQPAALRPPREVAALQRDFDAFLEWVARRPGVRLATWGSLYEECSRGRPTWIQRQELLEALRQVGDPPRPVRLAGGWLSPAEIFGLAGAALARAAENRALPPALGLRCLLGPTEPPCPAPPPGAVPAARLLAGAVAVDRSLSETGALPARICAGAAELGPNAFLQAARRFLLALASGDRPDEVPLRLEGEAVWLAAREDFANLHFRGTWVILPPEFEAPRLAEMARWQAWTGKPGRDV